MSTNVTNDQTFDKDISNNEVPVVVDFGADTSLFIALALYSFTVIVGLLVMIFFIYPLILRLFTDIRY